jgi:hypothetical protein
VMWRTRSVRPWCKESDTRVFNMLNYVMCLPTVRGGA